MIFDSFSIKNVREVAGNDQNDNTGLTFGLYIGNGGDLRVSMQSGDTAIFKNLPDNTFLLGQFARIFETGTTCANILALS